MGTIKRIKMAMGGVGLLAVAGFFGGTSYLSKQCAPMPDGDKVMVRVSETMPYIRAMEMLEGKGIVRNARASVWYAKLKGKFLPIKSGTYEVKPGMTMEQVWQSLDRPMKQMVRIPEGWWIARVGPKLEDAGVCTATEYDEWAHKPESFKKYVKFDLPKNSLEGYLYPDTYDLPPMMGAKEVIKRQLEAFQERVASKVPAGTDLQRAVVVGSMVQCEVARDVERPIVAGVIENRLKKDMKLQIDATALYGQQKWENLGPGKINLIKSPYNTYLHEGLPPGPICSPSAPSVLAAVKPDTNDFYYYMAKPDKTHFFATSYSEHLNNINKARALARAIGG